MSAPFRYYLRVRYAECDAQKVVFNARYGDYVDLGFSEFLRALGYGEALVTGAVDFQLVKQTFEWKSSARYDEVIELSPRVKQLGNTSFTLYTEFRIAGTERVFVTAETVYVHVDGHSLAKQPLPAELRAALERGAPGVVIDHAGYLGLPP
ncbi:MAG TPA: thioesterase family protein [Nevskia sp.]|nr:thioesterase family protein [Nevskia sp.]